MEERAESGKDGAQCFLILLVMRHHGVASAASDQVQRRKVGGDPLGEGSGEKEEPESNANAIERSEVHLVEWLCDGC